MKYLRPATIALLALGVLGFQAGTGTSQAPVQLGIDAVPDGNTATFVGAIESNVSVHAGDTFEIDIFVLDVDDLVAWELYLTFDPAIVELIDADMEMFLATNPHSRLLKKWDIVSDGQHFLGAVDRSLLGNDGSGVLARLTLEAKAPGQSPVEFLYDDVDANGHSHGHAHTYAHSYAHAYPHTYAYAHSNADPYADTHAYTDTNSHAPTYTRPSRRWRHRGTRHGPRRISRRVQGFR